MKKKYILSAIFIVIISTTISSQTILGIDVSGNNGSINWQQVYNNGNGKTFAFIKATEGRTYVSSSFSSNINSASNAGVVVGAYHFARPDNNTAAQEAANFVNAASNYIGNGFLPPVLDIERRGNYSFSQLSVWIQDWLTIVENQTGVRPIIYMSIYYANNLSNSLHSYDLWIADWDDSPTSSPNTGNWNNWLFKQYSSTGYVSGISGNVDLNVFNGSVNEFNSLIGNSTSTPVNDNCNNAINLNSSSSCNYTNGSVDGATPDNSWNDATCDNYNGNSLAADVFYKFTATSTSHTITVHPIGNLDPVLSLYQGNNCYNLNEIDCSDNGGGDGYDEVLDATGLNIGETYWIRIYDFGSIMPTNGTFQICITNTGGSEDVTVRNATVNPTTINSGGTITVNSDQYYSGNQTTSDLPMIDLGYYLSTDCNLSSDDILLGDDASSIGSNDTYDGESEDLIIPASTISGNYYIIFNADDDNEVNESNENNNAVCVQITVSNTGGSEDVTVRNATINPTTINSGGTITVSSDQYYSGNQTTSDLPMIDLGYYLSTDCNLSSDDILLGDDASSIGSNDTYDGESEDLIIPASTISGNYYIIFNADDDNEVNESNENNNAACVQITINNSSSISSIGLKKNIILYPNPNKGLVYIKDKYNIGVFYSIFDINGRILISKNKISNNVINLNNYKPGIYLIKIYDIKNNFGTYRIIKN